MTGASDEFTVQFPYLPGGLEDFARRWCRNCSAEVCSGATTRARR